MSNRLRIKRPALAISGVVVCAAIIGATLWQKDAAPAKDPASVAQSTMAEPSLAIVARMDTQTVTREEAKVWLAAMPAEWLTALKDKSAVREQWIRERLAEKALVAEARGKHWEQRPEVIKAMDAATQQIILRSYLDSVSRVPADYPSATEVAAAYEQAKPKLNIPARYHLQQIFLAAPADDPASTESVRKQAQALVIKARASGADFASLAREYSQDAQSVTRGGDIGFQSLQQLVPEIRSTVAALDRDEISDPVQSPAGFHVIRLEESQPARLATLEEVEPSLRASLRQQRQQQLAQTYLTHLASSPTLSIDNAVLTDLLTQP